MQRKAFSWFTVTRGWRKPAAGCCASAKGTHLARWSAEGIEAVAHALNTRPRKTLGWKPPPPKHSTSSYCYSNKPLLLPLVESGQ